MALYLLVLHSCSVGVFTDKSNADFIRLFAWCQVSCIPIIFGDSFFRFFFLACSQSFILLSLREALLSTLLRKFRFSFQRFFLLYLEWRKA
jgi:hypothetical protein